MRYQQHAGDRRQPHRQRERHGGDPQRFYGTSFIANEWGEIVCDLDDSETGVLSATFDLEQVRAHRASMGFFRDRRPQLYGR